MAASTLVPPALLDDEAEVEPSAPPDVLDRLPSPRSLVGDPVVVEPLGDLGR